MKNVHVGRYEHPASTGYSGWIEADDRRWILFVPLEGDPQLFVAIDEVLAGDKVERTYVPALR